MENLLSLKNIGRTSALWLNTIGIHNYDELKEIGPVDAFKRIDDRGIRTSKVLLYALQGALLDLHWNDIPEPLKAQLCKDAGLS
ncbi:MAG: TfoX/Sxy family protein [Sinobacterium sp.]|nr:TfoX/Sxy family protein [Sinobacterium sp.]